MVHMLEVNQAEGMPFLWQEKVQFTDNGSVAEWSMKGHVSFFIHPFLGVSNPVPVVTVQREFDPFLYCVRGVVRQIGKFQESVAAEAGLHGLGKFFGGDHSDLSERALRTY